MNGIGVSQDRIAEPMPLAIPREGIERIVIVVQRHPNCLRLFVRCARRAASAACTADKSKAIRMPMMAMTTNSSARVNLCLSLL